MSKSIYQLLLGVFLWSASTAAYGQYYNLYTDDFEASSAWVFENGEGLNHFIIDECAGNSFPTSGTKSLYVAPAAGLGVNCASDSPTSYGYLPASTLDTVKAYRAITYTGCGENLVVQLDYKIETNNINDGAAIVYRLDNTQAWTILTNLSASSTWKSASYSLPVALNSLDFEIGFIFFYDQNAVTGTPLAIDNFQIKGLDFVAPDITCPPTHGVYGNATCSAVLPDLSGIVTVSDNCTATANLIISHLPTIGESITGNSPVEFTVKDAANNTKTCIVTIEIIDTIPPVVTCNTSFVITDNNNDCDYLLPDLTNEITNISDNCSNANFILSQTPVVGTPVNGAQNVTLEVTDEQGNVGTCLIKTIPTDNINPTIICPADKTIDNGILCEYTLPDYTLETPVSDNCNLMPTTQNPPANTDVQTGKHVITMSVRDQSGNMASCNFTLTVIENEAPIFTNCPADFTSCTTTIEFPELEASDNCLVTINKIDNTNLHSGDDFPIGITTLEYEAIDSSGNAASCIFDVTVFEAIEVPSLVQNPIELCNETQTTIQATPVTSGTGYWSLPPSSTLTIEDVNAPTTLVSGLQLGENKVIWNTSSQHCGDSSVTLIISNYELPSIAKIALDTTYSCNPGNVILTAQKPTAGSALWTSKDTSIIISNATNHNVQIPNLTGGWYDFIYTVSNGVCPSSTDSISVFKMPIPEIYDFPTDTNFCDKVTFELVGSPAPLGVEALWYFDKGHGEFSDETAATTLLTDYRQGTNVILYSFTNENCGARNDTITINYGLCDGSEFIIPSLITPNMDGKNDHFAIDGLNEKYPNCRVTIVNRWGGVVFESKGYAQPWEGTHRGKPLPTGTYYYVIDYNDGSGNKLTGPISIIR